MGQALSLDIRKRIASHVGEGKSARSAALRFNVSVASAVRIARQFRTTGRAYASWQKGGVENSNGRIRRWLPKRMDLNEVSEQEIDDIIMTMNLTPRRWLGYKTP